MGTFGTFGGQLRAWRPDCLACEASAEALPPTGGDVAGMKLVGPLGARLSRLRLGLRLAPAHEIERHCSVDEILQGHRIDLFSFVDVDGAPGIPVEALVE